MTPAWVGLGSNLGEPASAVENAICELESLPETQLAARSRLYRTPPWGPEQPDFINAVAKLETGLEAGTLLTELLAIEARHGRERRERWGPRTLDLDLLLYGKERIVTNRLEVPHPRLAERAFVLVPLAELEPELEVPGAGKVSALLACVDASGVEALAP
ncbi:MAG: 2-amino-4-hydroxy-6-hydroxymethyldihydropteridine diphosphokinase [Gammaproteobacteria bacterium]|nr:2-amino-4-hydroxy-6-hydroxymethyldihydropteridine diphosphokinase [Gammaproteobacteria bacterium]